MEIGDLFVLAMIAIGILSSLFGKKTAQQKRKTAPGPDRNAEIGPAGSRQALEDTGPAAPTRRADVLSHMDQILQELQLAPPDKARAAVEEPVVEVRDEARTPPPARPAKPSPPRPQRRPATTPARRARTEAAEGVLNEVPTDYAAYRAREHDEFHDKYVARQAAPGRRRSSSTRVRHFLDQHGLRGAILAKEILGPPKGLQ